MIVHGMSTHTQGYSSNFVDSVAKQLRLDIAGRTNTALTDSTGSTNGFLITTDYERKAQHLRTYELTWSPTTSAEKISRFAFDARLNKSRASLNRQLKGSLINDGFADAVLYLNEGFEKKMQEPVTNAIRRILSDHPVTNDQFVIITHSLGSKLTYDSLNVLSDYYAAASKQHAQEFTNLAARTMYMVMLANQIPLLRLGESEASISRTRRSRAVERFLQVQQQAVKNKGDDRPLLVETNILRILTVTDPNDLLSYPLERTNLTSNPTTKIEFGNVFTCNTPALLGWVAHPLKAHEGYFTNKKLVQLLINGVSKKKVRKCLTEPKKNT